MKATFMIMLALMLIIISGCGGGNLVTIPEQPPPINIAGISPNPAGPNDLLTVFVDLTGVSVENLQFRLGTVSMETGLYNETDGTLSIKLENFPVGVYDLILVNTEGNKLSNTETMTIL